MSMLELKIKCCDCGYESHVDVPQETVPPHLRYQSVEEMSAAIRNALCPLCQEKPEHAERKLRSGRVIAPESARGVN